MSLPVQRLFLLVAVLGAVAPAPTPVCASPLGPPVGTGTAGGADGLSPGVDPQEEDDLPSSTSRTSYATGLDRVLVEIGAATSGASRPGLYALRVAPFVRWQPTRTLELRAGVLLDAHGQTGGAHSFGDGRAELGETYLRLRSGSTRLTLGAQTVIWGRIDEVPLIDRVSRIDLTRLVLDDLPDRRLPQPALRWEHNWEGLKLDAVWLAGFRGAALPDPSSVWSPVDQRNGRVLGMVLDPEQAAFVRVARIARGDGGSGGAAIRLTTTGDSGTDLGFTAGRTRQSQAWLEADPARLLFTARHPHVRFMGVDLEQVRGDATWRAELVWSDDVPFTAPGGAQRPQEVWEAAAGVEFYPGGRDTRANLQLVGRTVAGSDPTLELRRYAGINGEVESSAAQGRWRVRMRFSAGLSVRDVYVSPRLSFVGWEPHEIYLAVHHFVGDPRTVGGFYGKRSYLAFGLRTKL